MFLVPRRWAHRLPNEDAILADTSADPACVSAWEAALAQYTGAAHAVAISSGRQGMRLIFDYLGARDGGEVIVPAYTLGDLVPLIEGLGLRAVPADIDPETLNVTAGSVAARFSPQTSAVLVLHAFGAPAPIEAIAEACAARRVPIVEDGAHALGARVSGRAAGTFGAAGFYSFEPTKPVNTYGGGAVVTNDADLAEHVRRAIKGLPYGIDSARRKAAACLKEQRLMRSGVAWPVLGMFATPPLKRLLEPLYRGAQSVPAAATRYAPAQAALGMEKLRSLDDRIAARARAVALYREHVDRSVKFQRIEAGATSTWYFLVAQLPCPAAPVRRRMLVRGVDAAVEDEIADDVAAMLQASECPNAAHAYLHGLVLPLFDGIEDQQVVRAARALNAAL
jgi:perosamine synthetase